MNAFHQTLHRIEAPRGKQRGIFDPKPHSLPQSPQLAGEPRRANINKLSSARFEETALHQGGRIKKMVSTQFAQPSPQLAGGFFQGEKSIRIHASNPASPQGPGNATRCACSIISLFF